MIYGFDDLELHTRTMELRRDGDVVHMEPQVYGVLAHLVETPKRDARASLDAIDGMTPFVAARVCLVALGAHAFPLDARLAQRLSKEGVCTSGDDPDAVAGRLARHFRAGQAESAYLLIEAWADGRRAPRSTSSRGGPRARSSRARSGAS